MLEVMSTLVS